MPRTEEANQKIRDERRLHILNVAAGVFSRQGLGATKIADIAAAGEMSQGLIYRYFASKEEIFAAIVEGGTRSPLAMAREIAQRPASPLENLRELLHQFISGMWTHPEYALMMVQVLSNQAMPPEVRGPALEQSLELQKILHQLIVDAQAAGEISSSDDPVQLTLMVSSCLQGLTTGRVYVPDAPEPDIEIIMRVFKA